MVTARTSRVGAPSALQDRWENLDWASIGGKVTRLQVRIAKAVAEKRYGKAKALQWLLTHSFNAKAWAVRRVVQNRGRGTPGVDGVTWKTPRQKMRAIRSLRRRGYKPRPLRRITIPKRNGKRRPLSIPTMKDRAMQALYLLALNPVAETLADRNSYGFRLGRSIADAHMQCFNSLAKGYSPQWVLEGDIEACFDRISHEWLLENVLMDKAILKAWLKAGYLRDARFYPTEEGTPQGGIISPVLANLALDGLEQTAWHAAPRRSKVNVVRYADDFIITGNSRELLEDKILPAVTSFLSERGLRISSEKTAITHIEQGFDFLGANIRKYDGKLLMKPAAQTARRLLQDIRRYLRSHRSIAAADLISALNPKIRGWAYQFRHLVAFRVFEQIDYRIQDSLWRWVRRQHPQKSVRWVYGRYYRRSGNRRWVFSARTRPANGDARVVDLFRASSLPIIRHVKVRVAATVFDPRYDAYFHQRRIRRRELRGPRPSIDPTF